MSTANRNIKILFISNPNSVHTRRWLDWFHRKGYTVGLIADAPLNLPWPEIELFDLPSIYNSSPVRWVVWAYWTHRIIHKWQPDILHAHRVSSGGWLGAFSGFHPLVISSWGSDLLLHPRKSRIANMLAHYAIRKADLVTAPSEELVSKSIEFGAMPDKVHQIHWGVDTSVFFPQEQVGEISGNSQIPPLILSIRAIKPVYNQDVILMAARTVLQKYPKARFVFLIDNPDLAYLEKLKQLATDLNIGASIEWKSARSPGKEMADLLNESSLVLSIPDHDGTPVSVLEALACGIPVITSDLPSLKPWIDPGKTGYLVAPQDSTLLAQTIITALQDSLLRQTCKSQAPAMIQARASHDHQMQRMEKLYHQSLERGK